MLCKIAILSTMDGNPMEKQASARLWIKRFGTAGFAFFLVKGLLWLIVPALIAYFSID